MSKPITAFTLKANGRLNKLVTPAKVHSIEEGGKAIAAKAIWDTGATKTCISEKLALALNLKPIGMGIAHTAGGPCMVNDYLIQLEFSSVKSSAIRCSSFKSSDIADVLIGMDVITTGDFSVTNADNKTYFSFRIPPDYRHLDYQKAMNNDKAAKQMKEHIKKSQTN